MIKLQDFAKQNNVTDRNVQMHLKKHESELEGHFERKGPAGTWLDEYACNYLKGLMRIDTIVVSDDNKELNKKIKDLEIELAKTQGAGIAINQLYEQERERNRELMHNNGLLEEKSKSAEEALETAKEEFAKTEEELREVANKLQQELDAEKNRKLTFSERFFGRKQQ